MRVYKEAIAAFSVGPLMYIQGMIVRKYAAELPEAVGPRAGVIGHGKPLRVLVLGDSSAAYLRTIIPWIYIRGPTENAAIASLYTRI